MKEEQAQVDRWVEATLDFNIREISGNKKFKKRLNSSNFTIAKAKIKNDYSEPITVGKDLTFVNEMGQSVPLANGNRVYTEIRQRSGLHFLYLLLGLIRFQKTENGEVTMSFPVGFIAGVPLAGGNFAVAQTANKRLERELVYSDLYLKTIQPGEEVVGFLCFESKNIRKLSPRRK